LETWNFANVLDFKTKTIVNRLLPNFVWACLMDVMNYMYTKVSGD